MNKKQKKMLLRIIIAAVLLIALQFIPITGGWRLAAYLLPYLIIGYDILITVSYTHLTLPTIA